MISFEGICELLHISVGRFRFLVASPLVRVLLLFAKHLFVAANDLKVPVMLECSQLRTFSGYNNFRSRDTWPDTSRTWEYLPAPCRRQVRSSCHSPSSPLGTIVRAVSVAVVAGIAARWRASAAAQSR